MRSKCLEPPKTLGAAFARAWAEIVEGELCWDRRERKAAAAARMDGARLLEMFDMHLVPGAPAMQRTAVQLWGGEGGEAAARGKLEATTTTTTTTVWGDDVDAFKAAPRARL